MTTEPGTKVDDPGTPPPAGDNPPTPPRDPPPTDPPTDPPTGDEPPTDPSLDPKTVPLDELLKERKKRQEEAKAREALEKRLQALEDEKLSDEERKAKELERIQQEAERAKELEKLINLTKEQIKERDESLKAFLDVELSGLSEAQRSVIETLANTPEAQLQALATMRKAGMLETPGYSDGTRIAGTPPPAKTPMTRADADKGFRESLRKLQKRKR